MSDLLKTIGQYFDLRRAPGTSQKYTDTANDQPVTPPASVLPQYLALAAGVIAQPYIHDFMASGVWNFTLDQIGGHVIFGLIIGLAILPAVYRSSFDPNKPLTVQVLSLFPLGIGWQSIFTSVTQTVLEAGG